MKTKLIALLLLTTLISFGQVPSGCNSSNWPSNVLTTGTGIAFTVPAGTGSGWTYKWVVTTPALQIVSGGNTTTAYIKGVSGYANGIVYVTRFKDGVSACSDMKPVTISPNVIYCNYTLSILDEYIDGTQSGSDTVHLSVGGNYPTGTTYAWTITRQDGSVQYYAPQATRTRIVSASIDNRITDASVVANYQTCTSVVTKKFRCAIPNSDIYGNLFPECEGTNNNGLSKTNTNIKISPNPTTNSVKFDGEMLSDYTLTLYNSNGVEVIKNLELKDTINLDNQPKGIYIYVITNNKGYKQEGKIIKE